MHKLVIGSVVPRPIAWASSVDAAGVRNLAPLSCAQEEQGPAEGEELRRRSHRPGEARS